MDTSWRLKEYKTFIRNSYFSFVILMYLTLWRLQNLLFYIYDISILPTYFLVLFPLSIIVIPQAAHQTKCENLSNLASTIYNELLEDVEQILQYWSRVTGQYSLIFIRSQPFKCQPKEWTNTLKQFVGFCLSVVEHFVRLALKGLQIKNYG